MYTQGHLFSFPFLATRTPDSGPNNSPHRSVARGAAPLPRPGGERSAAHLKLLASSRPATNSSKRSTTPGRERCGLARGEISTGWSSTKVGCCRLPSTSASNTSFSMWPTGGGRGGGVVWRECVKALWVRGLGSEGEGGSSGARHRQESSFEKQGVGTASARGTCREPS